MAKNTLGRRYYPFFKMDSDQVVLFEERVTNVLNFVAQEMEQSRASIKANHMGLIFEMGVNAYEEQMSANLEESENSVVHKRLRELRTQKARNSNLAELYEGLGLDAFVEWCDKEGIKDWEAAIEEYNTGLFQKQATAPWSEKATDWLAELLGDGRPHHITEVQQEAIRAGLIDDTNDDTIDRDWSKLKVLASRKGYSAKGARGWWEE